ncbi:MAG: TRAP transporter large permease [bacterium]
MVSPLFIFLFLGLMFLGLPVLFALLLAPGIGLFVDGQNLMVTRLVSRMISGIQAGPLLAIPFFMLAGELMNQGGITKSLVDFSDKMIGHFRAGLAQVNILSSILFAGLSGSAVADTSAIGSMLIPAMEKNGYSTRFSAAITAVSSVIGPIIPPSGIMILYAFVMNVSVGGLFAAGIVPGLLVGISLMVMTRFIAIKRNYPMGEKKTWGERGVAFRHAFFPLMTPVLLLGGILSGVFTPTEASAFAAAYALIISLFVLKTISFKQLPEVFLKSAMTSGAVLLLVGAAVAFSFVITISGIPRTLTEALLDLTENKYLLLFIFNIILLITGMFLDAGPAILILGPILGPTFISLGVEPLHFAIMMCVNLTVGLATPPMGLVLFVASSISGERIERIVKEMLPFLAVEILVILLITYVPEVSLTLPRLLGFLR